MIFLHKNANCVDNFKDTLWLRQLILRRLKNISKKFQANRISIFEMV